MAVQDVGSMVTRDFFTGSIGDMQRLVVGTGDAVLPWVQEVANHDATLVKDEVQRAEDELAGSLRYTGAPASSVVSLLMHPLLGDKKITASELPALPDDYAALRGRLLEASAAFAVAPSNFDTIGGISIAVISGGSLGSLLGSFLDHKMLAGAALMAALLGAVGLMGALKAEDKHGSKRDALKNLANQLLQKLPESIKSDHFKMHLVNDPQRLVTGGYAQRYVREMISEAEGMIADYNEFIRSLEILCNRMFSRRDAVNWLAFDDSDRYAAQLPICMENKVYRKTMARFQSEVQELNRLIAAFRSLPAAPQGENVTLPEIDAWCASVLSVVEGFKTAQTRYKKSVEALQSLRVIAK